MAHATRLAQEVEFFDRWANENAKHLEPVDGAVLDRYRRPGSLYPKEYCFRLLGDLAGKRILDVGCGEGEDAMILARLGARVTGLDVSPAAVELARQRAAINGVADLVEFVCAPLNAANLPEKSFDVVRRHRVIKMPNNVPGPTITSVTPCAIESKMKYSLRIARSNQARVVPAVVVAHL